MTLRLYYTDPYCREFEATVERVEERDGRTVVWLDRTAFYPTSGGQPYDTGVLDSRRVLLVADEEDGGVAHVVDGAIERGRSVHGTIDWPRRFDHMQQHTGQHVLSAAFDKLFGARTVSFHLGGDVSTIDLQRELSPSDIAAAESEANRIVWENRPVTIRFATPEEASRLPLRKEPAREGSLRLIDVDGFDLSACGGTHVSRTGAIGIIGVTSWERFKGGQRLEFVCGGRALRRFRALRDLNASAVRLLSILPEELPDAIERLQAEAKDQRRSFAALQQEVARYRADELAASAVAAPKGRLVVQALESDAAGLKALAAAVAAKRGYLVVLVSAWRPALLVVARSEDVDVAANRVVAEMTSKFGGRGGGRPDLAQAGGLDADPATILQEAKSFLERLR